LAINRIEIDHTAEPKRAEIRDPQRHGTGNVRERVAPFVAVRGGVRQLTAANAVEHDQEDTREGSQEC
jgi:hypothetical protein